MLKKLNIINNEIIRELGEKKADIFDYQINEIDDILNEYQLNCTFNFNRDDRFYIDAKDLSIFINKKEIKTVTYRLYRNNKTISYNQINNENIVLYFEQNRNFDFNGFGDEIRHNFTKNTDIEISIDRMNWIDIFLTEKLDDTFSVRIHIILVEKEKNE